jgi:CubicO group peptidase (beta-lactamase class C family)
MGDQGAVARLPKRKQAAVEGLIDEAFKDEAGIYAGVSWGIVVVKNGKIVAERYQHGMGPHYSARTNSMCKSISGTLTGIGVHKGLLDIDRKAPLTEWRGIGDPRGEITLRNLMQMASGLYTESAGDRQGLIYQSGAAVVEAAALNVVDSRPGSRFVYAGSDSILLTRALREAIGDDKVYWTYPHRELLWKLGMTRTVMETDSNGDFISSGQCWSTARDFGRFGMLYLADGVWAGERLFPEGWSRFVATPAPAQPGGSGPRYGAQFWVYGGREGLPADAYSPNGGRGQYAMIVPSQGVVVVRRGFDGAAAFRIDKFSADVIRAIAD